MKKNSYYVFYVLLFSLSLFCYCFFQLEPDTLWHIKAGEYMYHHGILKTDIFSWTYQSYPWMSHEWLFEVVLYGLKKLFGNYYLFVYCFSSIFLLLFVLFQTNKKEYLKNIPFSLLWIFLSTILCVNIQGRPHLLSYLFVALTIYLCRDLYQHKDSKKIYFLPFLGIIWANIHGGSSNLVYLFPIIFLIAGLFQFQFKKIESSKISKLQIKRYIFVIVLCVIGLCINIHGFKMVLYPYQNMMNHLMISNISEWRSTSLSDPVHWLYFILLFVIVIVLLISKKKIQFLDFVLLLFCSVLGLKSIRFWFYTYLVLSYLIFYYIEERKTDKGTYLGIGILACTLLGLFVIRVDSLKLQNYSYLLQEKDISFIKKEGPKRLFNMYDYGGDLIYHDILVFMDGRADFYSSYNYEDYLKISNFEWDSLSLIDKYQFDYFLVDRKYPISTYLENSHDYEKIYSREDVLLYKKRLES